MSRKIVSHVDLDQRCDIRRHSHTLRRPVGGVPPEPLLCTRAGSDQRTEGRGCGSEEPFINNTHVTARRRKL